MTDSNRIHEENPGNAKTEPEGESQAHGTVLLVDDNSATREAIYDMLELLGLNVLIATGGSEALEIFQRECVDIVISDMLMPKMDGEALYYFLREIDPQVRMIILTGLSLGDRGKRLIQSGVYALLEKPPDIDQFTRTIQQALIR